MAQSDSFNRKDVKLTSLRVVDFKKLKNQKISWNFQQPGDLGVIGVKDFYERTTLFQAFQFGFGHDTDAEEAEVIVTMQHGDAGQSEEWHFKHTKKVVRGVPQMAYGIQIDGVDDAFRAVDEKEYSDKFTELNVFASGQPFCIQGNIKNVLASAYIDLRPFLEMYLIGKEKQDDNEDQFDTGVSTNQELLVEERKGLLECNKTINQMQQTYSEEKENRQCQDENERDSWLLQLFYYQKYSAVSRCDLNTLRQQICNDDGRQGNELDQQTRQWEIDLRAMFGHEGGLDRISLLDKQRKAIQEKIDAYVADARVLNTTDFDAAKQFGEVYAQFEHENLDLINKSRIVQFNLLMAELEWNPNDKRTQKKPFGDLLGQQWNGMESAMERALDEQKKEALEKLERASSFDAELYRFKDNAFDLNRYTHLPFTDGIITVESTALNSKTIYDYDEPKKESLNDHVIVNSKTESIPHDRNPFGRLISNENSKATNFDVIQSTLKLKSALKSIEENDFSELDEGMQRIMDTDCSGIFCQSADEERAPTDQKIRDLTNKVKETEQELMAKYSAYLNKNLPGLDSAADSAIDSINRRQRAFATSKEAAPQQIDWITQKVNELKSYKQQLDADELVAMDFNEQNMQELFIAIGKQMIESYKNVVDNACAKSLILLKEAILNSTTLAIDNINKIISKSEFDLPFDAKEETSPNSYFDEISARNANSIDPNAQISEIFKAVAAQVNKIKAEIGRKDYRILYDDPELSELKKKNNRLNKNIKNQIVFNQRQVKIRVDAFQKRFEQFVENFNTMAFDFNSEWNIQMQLNYDNPALKSHIFVTTDQNHAAALVLKLAINCTIGSSILIMDGQDFVIESHLMGLILISLKKLTTEKRIQVIFMVVNPEETLQATSTHHMWTNEVDLDEIADTTDLVLAGTNTHNERTSQYRSSAAPVQTSMEFE